MKKLITLGLLLMAGLFLMTGCSTNNFCNIDRAELAPLAETILREEIENKFDAVVNNGAKDSKDAIRIWLNANPNGSSEEYADYYIANNPKEVEKKSKSVYRACITEVDVTIEEQGQTAIITAKSWSDALKQGPIEAILVFPMAMLIIGIAILLGRGPVANLFSIIISTFIIRFLVTAATFKSTKSQQKMQEIQPELASLQQKYAGKTDQQSKMMQSQEMMQLYKKHNISPFGSILTMFVTLPIFISMYGSVQEVYALHQGSILGVVIGQPISNFIVGDFKIFALIILILTGASQVTTMKLTQWLQAYDRKKKHQVLDAKAREGMKQTNMMSNVMIVMVLFMAWSLPTAMSIYWIASSLFSIIQILVFRKWFGGKK